MEYLEPERTGRRGFSDAGGAKLAITLRLDAARFRKLEMLAAAENRSVTNYVETTLLRDMAAKEEAARPLEMFVPADAASVTPGVLLRNADESDARYAARVAVMDRLFDLPDSE
jgi:hypothetical protein